MTTNKRHVEIAQKIANDPYRLPHLASRDSLEHDIIQALASAERDAVERELVGLHDLVMSLDNRCGTATTMQYEVRDVVRKRLKAIQGGKDEG